MEGEKLHAPRNYKEEFTPHPTLSLSFQMAQLDQNLCRRKTKKKEWKAREREGKKMSSNVLQPNPPPQPKKIKAMFPQYPSATPQKSPSSSLSLHTSVPDLCGLFWVLLGQTFTEKTGNSEPSLYPPPSLFPLFFFCIIIIVGSSLSLRLYLFILSLSYRPLLCDRCRRS